MELRRTMGRLCGTLCVGSYREGLYWGPVLKMLKLPYELVLRQAMRRVRGD